MCGVEVVGRVRVGRGWWCVGWLVLCGGWDVVGVVLWVWVCVCFGLCGGVCVCVGVGVCVCVCVWVVTRT